MVRKIVKTILKNTKYKLINRSEYHDRNDILRDLPFQKMYKVCQPFTMTSVERMYALYKAIEHIIENKIPGDFVECGVWKGGSVMLMAMYLAEKKITDRKVFLYDTFEGMTEPNENDLHISGKTAKEVFLELKISKDISDWCNAPIEEVIHNMSLTNFPLENIQLVKGKVEDTIPEIIPENQIALLRLDTDWYVSTKHELVHLYPLLSTNGFLILDDFGHWAGSKKAVLEYFKEEKIDMFLNRIDYSGRIGIKTK